MRITLTGATGFLGKHLVPALLARGDELTILSRTLREGTNPRYLEWDSRSAPPPEALDADAVIHLAGEKVAQRWNDAAKQRIRSSRIESTRALAGALSKAPAKPAALISATAIGIYGTRGDDILTESSPAGSGFLAEVSADWEREAQRAREFGIRVVNLRIGVVLGPDGGALASILPPFKAGAGGKLGSGRQWMSWIHVDDVTGLIVFALDHPDVRGPLNATAPEPVRNEEFSRELAGVLKRPAVIPVPVFALKLLLGEMASVVLASQRVIPKAALQAGYQFLFPQLRAALAQILSP